MKTYEQLVSEVNAAFDRYNQSLTNPGVFPDISIKPHIDKNADGYVIYIYKELDGDWQRSHSDPLIEFNDTTCIYNLIVFWHKYVASDHNLQSLLNTYHKYILGEIMW